MENWLYLCIELINKSDIKNMVASYLKKNWITILGVVIGSAGGFLYWRFVGCSSGSCPITSSPVISAVWGAILGGLLFSLFTKKEEGK